MASPLRNDRASMMRIRGRESTIQCAGWNFSDLSDSWGHFKSDPSLIGWHSSPTFGRGFCYLKFFWVGKWR
jgi:hypothetical protein